MEDRNLLRRDVGRRVLVLVVVLAMVGVAVMLMPIAKPVPPAVHAYMLGVESVYGMSDEVRCAANHIGKEINALRAQNRNLGMLNIAETAAQIKTNDKLIGDLLGDLDRLPTKGVPNILYNMTCPQTKNESTMGNQTHVVGNREIVMKGVVCTSGVVVERTAAGGVVETGVLTNEHCGDAGDLVDFPHGIFDSAEMDKGVFYGCDCTFVRLDHEYVSPDAIWTEWGEVTIPEYRDFEVGEWVEFHGRSGYSLGRVLVVMDVWGAKVYAVDVEAVKGDSGGPFIALRDGSFGGILSTVGSDWSTVYGFSWQTVQQTLGVKRP